MNYVDLSQGIWDSIVGWVMINGFKILLILIVAFFINLSIKRVISHFIRRIVVRHKGMSEEAEEKREDTLIRIFHGTAHVILILVVVLMILSEFGLDIGPLIAGAGVIGLAVGFGGQYLIRDVITGFFIILENQYRVGDAVKINDIGGAVEDITLRSTVLRDLDGVVHHIPHGEVTTVSNMSKGFSRINIDIGVSYSADLNKVKEIVDRVGQELSKDVDWQDAVIDAPKFLRVDELADSAVIIKIVGDTKPLKQWAVAGEVRKRVKEAFDKEGVEIPFPQMVVHQSK